MNLTEKTCVPCKGGVEPMHRDEAERHLVEVPGWEFSHNARRIERHYRFKNFRQAQEFVNKVGDLAEQEKHHPEIHFGFGHVEIELWTHKIDGLHENDFILAAKINQLA